MTNNEESNEIKIKTLNRTQDFVITAELSKAEKLEYIFITNQDTSRRDFKPPK